MPPLRARNLILFGLGAILPGPAAWSQSPWVWQGEAWADPRPFLSPVTAEVKANLQVIALSGMGQNRILGRMGEFGDSITYSMAFFHGTILFGPDSNETGHDYDPIRSWVAYSGTQPADGFSFYRDHGKDVPYGNFSGWVILDAVASGHPTQAVETGDGVTPGAFSWALVMFGTNDIDPPGWDPTVWHVDLVDFADAIADLGVIPVLSTIPPEVAHIGDMRVEIANRQIREVADELAIPYVDYYRLILHYQPVDWFGTLIGPDGTHPSAGGGGRDFSQDGLTTTDGYAARTKQAFDMAEKLRAIVFEDGEPEPMFADDFESGHTDSWFSDTP